MRNIIPDQIEGYFEKSSLIRKMFEVGISMKKQFGAENIYDFSLGNPDVPPPKEVGESLAKQAEEVSQPLSMGYMPNAGLPAVREMLAEDLSEEQKVELSPDNIIVSCGAAGAINSFLRAAVEPDEEVICPIPFFGEYFFYVENFGAKLKPVQSKENFKLDIDAIEATITEKTRAIIINSPNNPSGQIISEEEIIALSAVLTKKSEEYDRPIYLISDEPYRFLIFENAHVPPILPHYEFSLVIGSYSKSLSLAGARIGYIATNPNMREVAKLTAAITMTTRVLGFVNASIIAQKIILHSKGVGVDVNIYDERRIAMAKVLDEAGIKYQMPKGAFYFFPEVPEGFDDLEFVDLLQKHKILGVPGRAFGAPKFFRLSFCVSAKVIEASGPAFKAVMKEARSTKS
ncbi:MAG: pyridoxal phosphate-dependent aminotransferase [Kiritimatiellae bacterium]|jgi:aspartate aminotransferase|nr:pyridoxal phosphate-dependent aminotransferase [Kiritimatiellia bacterium]